MNKYALDSSAWIDYFSEKNSFVRKIIKENELVTSIIAIAEVADKFLREDMPFQKALIFMQENAKIINLDVSLALEAAGVKKKHRETKRKFGLADAIHIVTAQSENAVFLTKDKDFEGLRDVEII